MTPEEIAALLQQPSRQQSLLDVLRGKQSLGYAGQLTGDKVLAPFGAGLQREAASGLEDAQARPNAVLGRALEYARLQDSQKRTAAYEAATQAKPPPDPRLADLNVREKEAKVKKIEASLAPKAPKQPAAPDEVPFADMVFQFQGDPNLNKQTKALGQKAVREAAAKWNTVTAGLTTLEDALGRFIKDPSPKNRALLYGPALSAAGATNAAIGQGAMSQDEKAAQFQALGVNFGDAAGLQSLVERAFSSPQASADFLARVKQMKELARSSVAAQGQPYKYFPKGAGGPSTKPAGPIKMKFPDGKVYDVPADKLDAAKRRGGVEVSG